MRRATSNSSSKVGIDQHFKHETVLLSFGQRVSAFLLNRVLSGQHKKWIAERMPRTTHRHLAFLHGFQQGSLSLGWRAVDFVSQNDIGKQGTFHKATLQAPLPGCSFEHFGASDIRGHKVGRELNAAERQAERFGSELIISVLADRHTFQQTVAATEKAD